MFSFRVYINSYRSLSTHFVLYFCQNFSPSPREISHPRSVVTRNSLSLIIFNGPPSFFFNNLPRQLHQLLPQLLILRHRAPFFNHRGRTDILSTSCRCGSSKYSAHTTLELVLFERLHRHAHRVTTQRVRFMDIFLGHCCFDDTRVCGVN